jgi:acetylornithine deacetylase/succinyl-diaminopimelate desuccinylase-like protein
MDVDAVLSWIDEHRDEALADLVRYCSQPSVAAQGWGMEEMAAIVERSLRGLEAQTQIVPTRGYPVVVGRLDGEAQARLMIYNHYDVQPPEPYDEWTSPPFEPQVRDGAIYARGAADNKGNVVARIWAVRAWLETHGTLPCGVTFLIEGEEEVGSPHLGDVPVEHPDLVRADACLWEAGYRDDDGALPLYAGLKGMLYVELHARGVAYDLHSANATLAPSAAWRLVGALQSLRDGEGRVRIPGFYDDVVPPTDRERELMRRFALDPDALRERWQVERLLGPDGDPAALTERSLFTPTCNIAGLWGGYSGPGTKTVLPAVAGAKIDFRLVPDQNPEKILASLRAHLGAEGYGDVEVVELSGTSRPAQSAVETPLMVAMEESARLVYGIEPRVLPRMAATGPMEQLCQRHGLPAVGGAGVGHAGSRTHAPNENIRVEDFVLGIKHVAALLSSFARASQVG